MHNIPLDIRAEALLGYIPRSKRKIEVRGDHKRNAYEDIGDALEDESGAAIVAISRNGMYDILPECLFHPIDRFDNIPANEYKERFKEECEQQQIEEENARKLFAPFDAFLLELGTVVAEDKSSGRYERMLEDIICDRLPQKYENNRFIGKARAFLPLCSKIRGNKCLLSFMLRFILRDENIRISEMRAPAMVKDKDPRYLCQLDEEGEGQTYLGNEFEEEILAYGVQYWNEDECGPGFLKFTADMALFEQFLNDYFISIESCLKFHISAQTLPVRLSDEEFFTYLGYNTNL